MDSFFLTREEDIRLCASIILPYQKRSLYEYLCELPLNELEEYPKKGYHWWMGRAARSPQALEARDYILHWRRAAVEIRQNLSREFLETLTREELRIYLRYYIQKVPLWAYEDPVRDMLQLLSYMWEDEK